MAQSDCIPRANPAITVLDGPLGTELLRCGAALPSRERESDASERESGANERDSDVSERESGTSERESGPSERESIANERESGAILLESLADRAREGTSMAR